MLEYCFKQRYLSKDKEKEQKLKQAEAQTHTPNSQFSDLTIDSEQLRKNNQRRKLIGFGLAAFSGICYGSLPPLVKWAYGDGATLSSILAIRFAIACATVWAVVLWQKPALRTTRSEALGFGLLGLIFVGSAAFYYTSLNLIASGTSALLVYVFPALVVIWSALLFREKPNRYKLLALVLALLGCALTVDPIAVFSSSQSINVLGIVFAFGSALCNSWYAIVAAHFGKRLPGLTAAAWSLPVTLVSYTIYALLTNSLNFSMGFTGWICCLAIGFFTGVAIFTYLMGVERIGASRTAITATTEPGTTVLLGILLLGESLSPIKLLGGGLIILAIVLLNRS